MEQLPARMARGSGRTLRSFLRSAKSSSSQSLQAKTGSGGSAAVFADEGAVAPAAQGEEGRGAPPDLGASVRNWQLRQQPPGGSKGETDSGQQPQQQQQQQAAQDSGLAVEARSDSLLQWRLPPQRTKASPTPAVAPGAASWQSLPPARVSSASAITRTLSEFRKRLFGGPAGREDSAGQQQQQLQHVQKQELEKESGAATPWTIAAVRSDSHAAVAPDASQQQPLLWGLGGAAAGTQGPWAGGSGQDEPQPESPGKTSEHLSRLKLLTTDRRRVWSAPIAAAHLQAAAAEASQAPALLPPPVGARVHSPSHPTSTAPQPIEAGSADSAGSPEASPWPRAGGLHALKARARTARVLSSSSANSSSLPESLPPGGAHAAGGSAHFQRGSGGGGGGEEEDDNSLEALTAVFGPDRGAHSGPVAAAWSPLKPVGSGSLSRVS